MFFLHVRLKKSPWRWEKSNSTILKEWQLNLTTLVYQHHKYGSKSPEALEINRAICEYIYMPLDFVAKMVSRSEYFPGCRYRVWNCSIVTTLTSFFPSVMATFAVRGLCHLNLNVSFCCTAAVLQFIKLEDWHPAGPTGEGVYLSNALCWRKEPFSQADSCASISQPNVQPPRSWSLTRRKAGSRENHPHALSVGFF